MQRFECVEGNASKFWEVSLQNNELLVRFGRIGTQGQSQTKVFTDQDQAMRERAKLIAEKSKKGYREIGVAKAEISQALATAQSVPTPQPPVVEQIADPQSISTPTEAFPSTLNWPRAGISAAPEIANRALPMRGIFAPGLPAETPKPHFHPCPVERYQPQVVARNTGGKFVPWNAEQAAEGFSDAKLEVYERGHWHNAILQAMCELARMAPWLVQRGIALHGLAKMADLVIDCAALVRPLNADLSLRVLRTALASADEEAYQLALAAVQGKFAANSVQSVFAAYVFPTERTLLDAAIGAQCDERAQLLTCVWEVQELREFAAESKLSVSYYGIPQQIKIHGTKVWPLMFDALDQAQSKYAMDQACALLQGLSTPEMLAELILRLDIKPARDLLQKLSKAHADAMIFAALRVLHQTSTEKPLKDKTLIRVLRAWTIGLAKSQPMAASRALAVADKVLQSIYQDLMRAGDGDSIDETKLPNILREPPWLAKNRPAPLPQINVQWPHREASFDHALLHERAAGPKLSQSVWSNYDFERNIKRGVAPAHALLQSLGIEEPARSAILHPQSDRVFDARHEGSVGMLSKLQGAVALHLWNVLAPSVWADHVDHSNAIAKLLLEHQLLAVPALHRFCQKHLALGLDAALVLDDGVIAKLAVRVPARQKRAWLAAQAWIKKFPETAALAALQDAFSAHDGARLQGSKVLRQLIAQGFEAAVEQAARQCGEAVLGALAQLKATDAIYQLPNKIAKLPDYVVPEPWRRPMLKSGGTLSAEHALHIATMLSISTLAAPYAGLEQIKQACTDASLADFAWDLFEAWEAASAPTVREGWPMTALALLGNDQTARLLAPKIRYWAANDSAARASNGLDLLAALGSDIALMQLNTFALRAQAKALKSKAQALIDGIALARELSTEQLADRLVPDLGLDEQRLELDFGPRQFIVSFDETLTPVVRELSGARLASLPRSNKNDDPSKAKAASDRFKQLKTDAKAIASLQIARLENAMVRQRRWTAEEFEQLFIAHPLMRHLAQRLVFADFNAPGQALPFRVAEDLTLADAQDQLLTLPADAKIGIAHPLELSEPARTALVTVFADYAITQPFKQLTRELYEFSEAELTSNVVTRFAGRKVGSGSIRGLQTRAWSGVMYDGGLFSSYEKITAAGDVIEASLEPGIYLDSYENEPQRITEVVLHRAGDYGKQANLPLSRLSAVEASEMLRDLDRMAAL